MTATTEDRASALRSSLDDAAKLIGSQRQTISELRDALQAMRTAAAVLMEEALSVPIGRDHLLAIDKLQRADDKARAALSRTGE